MKPIKRFEVTLCPECGMCPVVEITERGVTIGERENTVRLSHSQWNDLVARIRQGELSEV